MSYQTNKLISELKQAISEDSKRIKLAQPEPTVMANELMIRSLQLHRKIDDEIIPALQKLSTELKQLEEPDAQDLRMDNAIASTVAAFNTNKWLDDIQFKPQSQLEN